MSSISSIAQSGMQAALQRQSAAANNIANQNTDGFRRERVDQQADPNGGTTTSVSRMPQPGSQLEQDMVDQISSSYSFQASLKTLKVNDQMMGTLLDVKA